MGRHGDHLGKPMACFLSGVREKSAGEAEGCRNPAVSSIFYSCDQGTLWLQIQAQVAVLIATLIPVPEGTSA